jgi:neutral ceramidase
MLASAVGTLTCQAAWNAGTAKIKITPEQPLVMSGYASRTTPFKSVERDLWAKALILEDETGKQVAIITTDLAGIYSDISPAIYAGITERTGMICPSPASVVAGWM